MVLFNNTKNRRVQNNFESTNRLRCISQFYSRKILPTKYFEKPTEVLTGANGKRLNIKFKLSKVHVCNKEHCFKTSFLLLKDLRQELILETSFITQLYTI